MELTEIWQTIEETPGVTHMEKMGKRAVVFLFEGVRHSVYMDPIKGAIVLFREGNKMAALSSPADIPHNLNPVVTA